MNEIQGYKQCEKAIQLKGQIENGYLTLAALLKDIRDGMLYQPQYSKFSEWLQELDMTEGTASKMITTYDTLILSYEFDEQEIQKIGWTKGYMVAQASDDKQDAKELVELAKVQTSNDLRQTLKEKKTGVDQMLCEHDLQTFSICKKCGLKICEHK
jgi:hypothetical protein